MTMLQPGDVVENGLLALPREPETWIWAFTCPTNGCECREAIVLAAEGSRDALVTAGAPVRNAWLARSGHAEATVGLRDVDSFAIDIDDGEIFPVNDTDDSRQPSPELRAIARHIDGEMLDAIGRLWFHGKGQQDPEEKRETTGPIEIEEWLPGDTVAWEEVFGELRRDLFRFGERVVEAFEHYCVKPGCDCGEVVIDFQPLRPRGAPEPGALRVRRDGTVILEPSHARHRDRLSQLWDAFRERHPRFVERFARRSARMHAIGPRIVGAARAPVPTAMKVGRNDPCPCGSSKKFKKCCGR